MLDIALLGTGGMVPLPNRYLTSLLCRLNGSMLLIDCGEGTQVTLKLLGWGYKNIDTICITHFHADHVSGLPGLLLAIGNAGREEALTIIGPPRLAQVVKGLCIIAPELPFPIEIIELPYEPGQAQSLSLNGYQIGALPMEHGMHCFGYSLEVHRIGKFDPERAKALGLPVKCWSFLQKGETVIFEDQVYTPGMVLGPPRKGLKVSYCTDSRPHKGISGFIEGSDLFICEGLYGDQEKLAKARDHRHMIYSEAACLARDGHAGELWLTHYSPAMPNPKEHLQNALDIFSKTILGKDRMTKALLFAEE